MLKKSKLFVIAIAIIGAFAFTSVNAADLGSSTLRKGSTGPYVVTLQTLLGVSADGAFGPMTEAAVKAWQASHGLVADGIVGPATKAAMNAGGVTPPPASGCQAGWTVNPMTGAPCTAQLPAGCQPGYVYSVTTGAKCDGGTTTTTDTSGPLVGGAGDMLLTKSNTSVESTITEGKDDQKVLSFKVEADGSDISVTNIKLSFVENSIAANSTRLDRYVDSVSIWMGSTEVATIDVDDFSKSSSTYSKSVNLSNAIVREGSSKKATFYVTVDASESISSDDTDAKWLVTLSSLRFQDATGVIMTATGVDTNDVQIEEDFGFESSTENDELKLMSSSNNPVASNLKVEDQDDSDDHMVLAFKLKADADSSDLNVLQIVVSTDGEPASVESIISDIYLKVGSTVYDNYTQEGNDFTFEIDEGDLAIDAGDTEEVKVYVSFIEMDEADNYPEGQLVQFIVDGNDIVVENVEGDSVDSPTNTITGNVHSLQLQSVNFKLLTPTIVNSSESASIDPYVTITVPLQITTDEALYMLKLAGNIAGNSDAGVAATIETTEDYTYSFVSGSGSPTIVNDGNDDYYEIDGTSTVYLKFIVNGDITGDVQDLTVQLESVLLSEAMGDEPVQYELAPASSFDVNATLRYLGML